MQPPNSHHLEAAQGWLELGNHEEANEELELIDAPLRSHPDVLEVRWGIYAKVKNCKNWEACLDIGKAMAKLDPGGSLLLISLRHRRLNQVHNCVLVGGQ